MSGWRHLMCCWIWPCGVPHSSRETLVRSEVQERRCSPQSGYRFSFIAANQTGSGASALPVRVTSGRCASDEVRSQSLLGRVFVLPAVITDQCYCAWRVPTWDGGQRQEGWTHPWNTISKLIYIFIISLGVGKREIELTFIFFWKSWELWVGSPAI